MPADSLSSLLSDLRVDLPPHTLSSLSSLGVIVWNDLWQALQSLDRAKGGFKALPGAEKEKPGSRTFELFHFNGIAKTVLGGQAGAKEGEGGRGEGTGVKTVGSDGEGARSGANSVSEGNQVNPSVQESVLSGQQPRLTRLLVTVPPKWTPDEMILGASGGGDSSASYSIPGEDGKEVIVLEDVCDSTEGRRGGGSSSALPAGREAPLVDCIRTRWKRAICWWDGPPPSIV